MNEKNMELFKHISNTNEHCATDMAYSLEMLRGSLRQALTLLKKEMKTSVENNSFEDVSRLASYCNQIAELNSEIEKMHLWIHINSSTSGDKKIDSEPVRDVPIEVDCVKYEVNSTEQHTLNEDFEYKKIFALQIKDKKWNVSSWQDALIKLCLYLYGINESKMVGFVDDPRFKRRKVSYFMKESVPRRNKLIPGTNLYVWVNNNANTLAALMRDMLQEYEISINDVAVYLRPDSRNLNCD